MKCTAKISLEVRSSIKADINWHDWYLIKHAVSVSVFFYGEQTNNIPSNNIPTTVIRLIKFDIFMNCYQTVYMMGPVKTKYLYYCT